MKVVQKCKVHSKSKTLKVESCNRYVIDILLFMFHFTFFLPIQYNQKYNTMKTYSKKLQ